MKKQTTQTISSKQGWTLLRTSVILALLGMLCVLVYLWRGFEAFTIGLGIFVGVPLLLVAMLLYVITVVSDLRQRGVL